MPPNNEFQTQISGVKRARVAKSCTICRQKKIKCDKLKPACGTCVKKGRTHLCQYEEPEWNINVAGGKSNNTNNGYNTTKTFDTHISKVKQQIKQFDDNTGDEPTDGFVDNHTNNNLNSNRNNSNNSIHHIPNRDSTSRLSGSTVNGFGEDDPVIDFYKNNYGSPRMITQGVLTWVTLLKKDIYLNAIVQSSRREKVLVSVKPKDNTAKEKEFISKYKTQQDLQVDLKSSPLEIPKCANKDVIDSVKDCLKDLKLVWVLIDKFFDCEIHCFLPLFDKTEFKNQVSKIIGPQNDINSTIKINKRIELSTVGCLLVIMRFSSLTLYNALRFDKNSLSPSDLYIYEYPIPKYVVNLAQKCLNELREFREANLQIFQLEILIRYYSLLAPEDCDCVSLACTQSMGPLIHSAMSNGLNRDPTIAQPDHPNPNLLRRLWFKTLFLDNHQVMLTGVPPMINERFYDTKPPTMDANSPALDYYISEKMHERGKMHNLMKPLLNLILDIKEPPKLSTVRHYLKPLEHLVSTHPNVDAIMRMSSDTILQRIDKICKMCCFVDAVSLLYMIYYHFYLFYNERQDSKESFRYLIQLIKLMSFCTPLARFLMSEKDGGADFDLQKHFGIGIVIIPKIELHLHKCIQLMFSILARIKDMRMSCGNLIDATRMQSLDAIYDASLRVNALILKAFANVSDTYYHTWSIQKMHEFIIKGVFKNECSIDPKKAQMINEKFLNSLNQTRDHDGIFTKYTNQELNSIYDHINDLELSLKDQEKTSPASSIDMTFNNLNNPTNNMIWLNQFQDDTNFLYDGKTNNLTGLSPTNSSTSTSGPGSKSISTFNLPSTTVNSNTEMGSNMNLDGSDVPLFSGDVNLFDLDRFFYQTYGT